MKTPLFTGKQVSLKAIDLDVDIELLAKWQHDSQYSRLLDSDPTRLLPAKMEREGLERWLDKMSFFIIHKLEDDQAIGLCDLSDVNHANGNAWVGIGIGESSLWGQGYGTDAMRVLIRYGFEELNLQRISLSVFEYNPRAKRSYEKLGFKEEGREREAMRRDGRRWDLIYMGLLRSEWQPEE